MPIFLAIVLALLFVGVLVNLYLSPKGPDHQLAAGAGTVALALLVWLVARLRLPLAVAAGPPAGEVPFAAWTFAVDANAWHLAFVLLLLVLGLFIAAASGGAAPGARTGLLGLPAGAPATLALTFAAMVGISAGTLATLMAAGMLLIVVWLGALFVLAQPADPQFYLRRAAGLLPGLLFLGLALATAGPTATEGLVPATWQSVGRNWAWLAAAAWLGAFPLRWWRLRQLDTSDPLVALLHVAPAFLGASLAIRLAGAAVPPTFALLLTLFSLLGLASGASFIWERIHQARPVIGGLFYAQIHLVLLAAMWAGPAAALAETRVLALAGGLLWLASFWREDRARTLAVAQTIAAAAVAGLPLTYGFIGRAALFAALTDGFRLVLMVVTALLTVPIVAAVILLAWNLSGSRRLEDLPRPANLGVTAALAGLAIALLALPGTFAGRDLLAGALILLVAAGGVVISRAISRVEEAQAALRQAFRPAPLGRRVVDTLQVLGQAGTAALREAVAIMEGEGGLLWLLALLVVLWLSRQG